MDRVKIAMPDKYLFSTEIRIRITDINYGGHLANDAVLSIAHEARLRFLALYNYTEKNIESTSLIMLDAAIIYKSEAFYGDVLKIDIAISELTRLGFDIFYRFKNILTDKDIAHVKTGMAFFNYDLRKMTNIPEKFISNIYKKTM